jgi:Rod binding domain-containing protein
MSDVLTSAAAAPPTPLPSVSPTDSPAKIQAAAQQFESLLIAQVLNMAHSPDGGWLGGGDAASSAATSFSEQQFAQVIAQQGGFGLSKLIAEGLSRQSSPPSTGAATPPQSSARPTPSLLRPHTAPLLD